MKQQPTDPSTLLDAAREPERLVPERDLPVLFGGGLPERANPFKAEEIPETKPGRPLRVVSYTKTFVLWRRWEKCKRCSAAIADGRITLPEDTGDHTCPHVQVSEYKACKDRVLGGDGVKEFEEHFQLDDGTRCVIFGWLEADPEYLKEQKKKAAEKTKNRVFPPDLEDAFKDPIAKVRERISSG